MSDQSKHAESTDPRVQVALREYLERVDRGEPVNAEEFLSQHSEIADALRSFIAAEQDVRKMADGEAARESAGISTRSIAARSEETVPPKAKPDRHPGTTGSGLAGQFGRYQIVRALGKGAMGAVYLAQDTQLKRNVAIKTPHFEDDPTGEMLKRFHREAESAATLRHANICPIHDVGEIDGKHFISMAYIEGKPLSDLIKSDKPQSERHILIAVHKLARALQEAHDHGIVHRDLKPANIMVDKKGEPIIMDFGLARKARTEGEASLTHSGMLLGSPAYMSPEQIEGDPESVGPASDQYSLGVVLYEMLTGQLPFRGSIVSVLAQIITKGPTPPSELRAGLDPRIEAVCLRMMAKKASDRFSSMKAVAEELATIVRNPASAPIAAEKSPTTTRPATAPVSSRGEAGASQIVKSVKEKTLTESDLTSLEELVRKCLKRRDYDQMIQIIERIPEARRTESLQGLLGKAREKSDEIAFLICEIDEADRLEDGRTALKKAEELLKVKPGHHRAREIQEKYSGYGEGAPARIGPLWQFTQPWNEGGWVPWSVLAFGLVVFGAMYGIVVIYLGKTAVVIDIKDSGVEVAVKGTTLTVTGPDKQSVKVEPGDQELKITYAGLETITKSFTLKRGDTKTVTVTLADAKLIAKLGDEILVEQAVKSAPAGPGVNQPQGVAQSPPDEKKTKAPATTGSSDPDRSAGEWVLSIGGTIRIKESGQEFEVKAANELPAGAFELTKVRLGRNPKVTDEGLACFKDCKNLSSLGLGVTDVSDAGLAYFKDCKNLTNLDLGGASKVTDTGLAYFKDCKWVEGLNLSATHVSDAGLAYFKDCKNLTSLSVWGPQVTDAGLVYFKDCKNLTNLDLNVTKVSDVGLADFKDCKWVKSLNLSGTQVSDAGLAYFKDCKNLARVWLDNTAVTDAGVERLSGFRNLNSLFVKKTNVTEAGVKKLAAALPRCKIEWDGGVFEAKADEGSPASAQDDFVPLFNGNDLTGWKTHPKQPGNWRVENGMIVGSGPGVTSHLYTERGDYKDFHLRIEARFNEGGNSGVYYRARFGPSYPAKQPRWLIGYNAKLDDNRLGAFLLDDARASGPPMIRSRVPEPPAGRWIVLEVIVRGYQIVIKTDGEVTAEYTDEKKHFASGYIALQQHTPQTRVEFRKIELKELTPQTATAPARGEDPDRRAAQAMLGLGAAVTIRLDGQERNLEAGAVLPAEAFELTGVFFRNRHESTDADFEPLHGTTNLLLVDVGGSSKITNSMLECLRGMSKLEILRVAFTKVSDAGLARLPQMGITKLRGIDLGGTVVTDAGLEHIENFVDLEGISLGQTRVTDAGLRHLEPLKNLTSLWIDDTQITDAGLVYIQNLVQLRKLRLNGNRITDAGLAYLSRLEQLDYLGLANTGVSGSGLVHLKSLGRLNDLELNRSRVTDSGLVHLMGLRQLGGIDLRDTRITDLGLENLKSLTNARELKLSGTKVTSAGVEKLRKSLPSCKIDFTPAPNQKKNTRKAGL